MDHQESVFLGIDVGSGSSRAALITASGELLAIASTPFNTYRPSPDFFEQSSQEIWQSVCTSVKAVLSKAKIADPQRVKGIGFDATCSLVVSTSGSTPETARPVSISPSSQFEDTTRDIIMWCDHRAKEQAMRITATKHDILKSVGGVMSLEMELPKTLWLKDNMPEEKWKTVGRLFDLPDYLTFRACGEAFPSRCSVVCKWCYSAKQDDQAEGARAEAKSGWPADFLTQIGLPELVDNHCEKLCGPGNKDQKVHYAGEYIGGLTETAAKELGLVPGIAVGAAVIDAYAGAIGTLGASIAGKRPSIDEAQSRIAIICGTSSCHLAMSKKQIFVPGVWGPYNGVMLPNMWMAEGGQSSTGQLIDHLVTTHPAYAQALELARAEQPPLSIYAFLNRRVESLFKASSLSHYAYLTKSLHLTPDHHGNRSPFADESMRGLITGLDLHGNTIDGLALLYLATLQALALGTKQILDALQREGYQIDTICISGGQSLNELFVEILADVSQLPIVHSHAGGEASVVFGAAICGKVAYETCKPPRKAEENDDGGHGGVAKADIHTALWDAMTSLTRAERTVEPNRDPALRQFYTNKYRILEAMQRDQRKYAEIMARTD
ncbi:hypothetical protein BGW41_006717 [Actinomortierella wolfii]|nr:hypothetical protein BGW41_006717 [Actinomortierella wolfii]